MTSLQIILCFSPIYPTTKTLNGSLSSPHSVPANMSEEEAHKKGRASELEGQQRASGRAMFLLSGPQREGAETEGGREEEEEWISSPFFLSSSLPGKS